MPGTSFGMVHDNDMAIFSSLPPEIIREILEYLSISSFLAFGLTSKNNHAIQSCSLTSLRLGVFHSRLTAMVSLMEAAPDRHYTHTFQTVLPKAQSQNRKMVVRNQNARVQTILSQYQHTLRDLEISLWELQEPAAWSISQLKNLRGLSIRLDQPCTSFPDVGRSFWETSPGSTIWNGLFAESGQGPILSRLESLDLERAGITDYQLEQILNNNPGVRDVRLRKCLNLTDETFQYLACSNVGRQLKTLHFTKHWGKMIDNRILGYIGKLANLDVSRSSYRHVFPIAQDSITVFVTL